MAITARQRLPKEVRALWVVRTSMVSPHSIERAVELASRAGFNLLFVQVRGRGDAYYRSRYEPRAEALANQPDSFDPLAHMLGCARSAGLQVHAWLNVYYIWSEARPPQSPHHLFHQRPDWIARDRHNRFQMTTTSTVEGVYLCPSESGVRTHLLRVFEEVAQGYPQLDGIHLDYVRYPNAGYCYCERCLRQFGEWLRTRLPATRLRRHGSNPLGWTRAFPNEWSVWRREQVSMFVSTLSKRLRALNPQLVLSSAVWANYRDAFQNKLQDWRRWLTHDWLDTLALMAYERNPTAVEKHLREAVRLVGNRPLIGGLGAWLVSPSRTMQKIATVRRLGLRGFSLFSYDALTEKGTRATYFEALKL